MYDTSPIFDWKFCSSKLLTCEFVIDILEEVMMSGTSDISTIINRPKNKEVVAIKAVATV
jgi:hypothetical protein